MPPRFLMFLTACLLWVGAALAEININTASQEQLDSLKGIGPSKARAIVDYRRKNGPFRSIDDLRNVPGIGETTLQGLRRDVVVSAADLAAPHRQALTPATSANAYTQQSRPASPARPGVPASLPKPAEPAVSHQAPVVSGGQEKPVATPPARPAAPAPPARPAGFGKPAQPAGMAKPATTIAKPAAPTTPARPTMSATQAASPTGKARPAAPAQPARPTQPVGHN